MPSSAGPAVSGATCGRVVATTVEKITTASASPQNRKSQEIFTSAAPSRGAAVVPRLIARRPIAKIMTCRSVGVRWLITLVEAGW
ncbi:hypothetical protein SRIMM317S_01612 [Streptomyces rimosus subsp. rimosus]